MGVSNLLWILVSHLISGVVHRGATGVTPVLLTIVDYCRRCSHLMLVTQWGGGLGDPTRVTHIHSGVIGFLAKKHICHLMYVFRDVHL